MNLQALVDATTNTFKTLRCTALGYLKVHLVDVNGDAVSVGGGSGGDASAVNQTAIQAVTGSNATKANAVQGIDGGKAVAISSTTLATEVTLASMLSKSIPVSQTSTAYTLLPLSCNGATKFSMSLYLTTMSVAPVVQLQGTDDGINFYNIGSPLTGVANSVVTMYNNSALPIAIRWYLSVEGTAGIGWSVILRAQ